MTAVVIDTNVLAVANLHADHASTKCVGACIDALLALRDARVVALDEGRLILQEYRSHASVTGQPGVGDWFLRYLYDNLANATLCRLVRLTPVDGDTFAEFPTDRALAGFDPSDRKFVAVALCCQPRAEVLNATDSDWWDYRDPLQRHGLRVRFLCPDMMGTKKRSRRPRAPTR